MARSGKDPGNVLALVTGPTVEPVTVAEARAHLKLDSTAGEPAPTVPTVGLVVPAAPGNCDNGAWRVAFTFVTADGETELGPLSAVVTVVDKAVNGQIAVSNIAVGGSAVTARRAYAIPPGGASALFAGTIANNTATTWTLNVTAASLGAGAPTTNTTADPEVTRLIQAVRDRAELATGRALQPQTWDQVGDAFPYERWFELPKPPLVSVTHIQYRDTSGTLQTWPASNYIVEAPSGPRCRRGRVSLAYGVSWPSTYAQDGAVTIRFVCGYSTPAAVPALLKTAMLLDMGMLYEQRNQVITGTTLAELPGGVRDIYRSCKSHGTQRAA
jgi:uncharacterized phiE125 gp8 family phage protein